ncbi:hypothetical protein J31TS4_27610 [Paenibacillus sp. J31TS4]|uniref:family 78 glycoside hydrolase catalytic domain n=1 Tax=Paenibacillus sp. J31TS4 TaxID=2807195 RepID=UPI001B0CD239|nr:family 78 glycoside hydrolase catalytic domain [Paenibacillus sp. J31TS4]GIP39481.1 hypothetical protein J31TS4_27610 [Paenibacillus sp. J31TS4]
MLGSGRWISDPRFAGRPPLSLLRKELAGPTAPEHDPELRNVHTLYRKVVQLPEIGNGAVLDITADDYYKLYVNGRFIGQGPAQGYPDRYFFNRYDLTEWVRPGANVIAVHVYYQGLVNRAFNSGDYRQGLAAELRAVDGTLLAFTDSAWKIREAEEFGGPFADIIAYNTQFAESIDSRLAIRGWREVDYDDSEWENAAERPDDDHLLVLQPTPVVDVYAVAPSTLRNQSPGSFVIDFGKELTGCFTMRAKGQRGDRIEIRCGEELEANGSVRWELRCGCTYRETWTLSGEEDVFEPYDYKGFRYVEVVGPQEAILSDSFAARVRHYPFPQQSSAFTSADETLNRVWDICRHAVRMATQEHFTDCPTREKGQYLGDNTITALSHLYLTGDLRIYRKALEDFAASGAVCPGLMAVAPGHHMQEIADYSLQWPRQLFDYYKHSGDRTYLQQMAPVAEQIIDYFERYERSDGLLENVKDKWNLVDWPPNQRDGYDFDLGIPVSDGCHNVINAFYFGALCAVEEIRSVLGHPPIGKKERFAEAFRHTFWCKETGLFQDAERSSHSSLHGNALALLFGLVPESGKRSVVSFLKAKKLSCGVYFSYFYLKALAQAGEREFVYSLLVTDEPHELPGPNGPVTIHGYWNQMLREGASACFESWSKELKWNTSLCHPWASSPIPILIEDILGLKPAEPGWTTIECEPVPAHLPDIDIRFPTVSGIVHARVQGETARIRKQPLIT